MTAGGSGAIPFQLLVFFGKANWPGWSARWQLDIKSSVRPRERLVRQPPLKRKGRSHHGGGTTDTVAMRYQPPESREAMTRTNSLIVAVFRTMRRISEPWNYLIRDFLPCTGIHQSPTKHQAGVGLAMMMWAGGCLDSRYWTSCPVCSGLALSSRQLRVVVRSTDTKLVFNQTNQRKPRLQAHPRNRKPSGPPA